MVLEVRAALQGRFVEAFADPGRPVMPAGEGELSELERALQTVLPVSYGQFLRRHGAVYCPSILRMTLNGGLEHPDLRQIYAPSQVRTKSSEWWRKGLPAEYFVFAGDCMGNPFCFRQNREVEEDAAVMFLSRQQEQLLELGETFDQWLGWYLAHCRGGE